MIRFSQIHKGCGCHAETIEGYIREQPKAVQPVMRQIQKTIREAIHEAVEVFADRLTAYSTSKGKLTKSHD